MKECIERDPLIKALDSLIGLAIICKGTDAKPDPLEMLSALREDVKTCSTADVRENVHGEWVEDDYGYIHCSHCGMEWDEPEHPKTNFCPNCGTDMKEETK